MEAVWDVVQAAVIFMLIVMTLWTFVKRRWREAFWDLLHDAWSLIRPALYRIVTGMAAPPTDETPDTPRAVMSRQSPGVSRQPRADYPPDLPPATMKGNGETVKPPVAIGETKETNGFTYPGLFDTLALQVHKKVLTETEALRDYCKANPGKSPRYADARDRLHAALAELRKKDVTYRHLDAQGKAEPVETA